MLFSDLKNISKKIDGIISLSPDEQLDSNIFISELSAKIDEIEFNKLKFLLFSDHWPNAVDSHSICRDVDEDKFARADSILNHSLFDLNGKRFLDFGCGEGYLVDKSLEYGVSEAYGYDIEDQNWNQRIGKFTSDIGAIDGKFDIIFVYDVLDHTNNPVKLLNEIISLLGCDGSIYLVCHPWCSRHGSHLYKQINKAYIHLVFSNEELESMGYKYGNVRRLIHPMNDYNGLFKHVKLKKFSENIISKPIESFFVKNALVANRIFNTWKDSPDLDIRNGKKFPAFQMEQEFCEFILK